MTYYGGKSNAGRHASIAFKMRQAWKQPETTRNNQKQPETTRKQLETTGKQPQKKPRERRQH
jgi:hypothetical protein